MLLNYRIDTVDIVNYTAGIKVSKRFRNLQITVLKTCSAEKEKDRCSSKIWRKNLMRCVQFRLLLFAHCFSTMATIHSHPSYSREARLSD